MKAVLALVVAVGLGTVVASVWVGARVKEPTVVANPYEEGLRYDESRRARDATRAPPAVRATLDVSPQPARAMTELTFTVTLARGGAPLDGADVTLALEMPGMYMGENRLRLSPAGAGRYRGTGTVVRCPSGRRTWTAAMEARPPGGATIAQQFSFEVADR